MAAGNFVQRICDDATERGRLDKPALHEGERTWTYRELIAQTTRVGAALTTLGVGRGDRVILFMRDTLEAAAAMLGVMRMGAVVVPLSELATAEDLRELLQHARAAVAIVDGFLQPVIDEVRAEAPTLRELLVVGPRAAGEHDYQAALAAASDVATTAVTELDDPCVLLYSTGAGLDTPRAVPHSHRALAAAFESYGRGFLALSEADRCLSVVRLSTAYGLGSGLLFPLAAGGQARLMPEQPRSEAIFAAVESFDPTVLFATPSIYGQLARDAEAEARVRPLAHLRNAVAGAEGMPERLLSKIKAVLATEVTVGYGLTEIFQFALASSTRDAWVTRPGACGRPLPGIQVRVVDDNGEVVGTDEIGTLQVRSQSMFNGYWGGDVARPGADGWFTTRDRFMLDAHGMYHHCGRVDDLFKVGGKWVSPVEVERALTAHEAVWEAAVIGTEDEDGLIKPLAFVVTNVGHAPGPGLEAELRGYIKHTLAPYKYPRWIEFVDALPRGPGGKLLRYKLRPQRARRRAETGHA
ncbi:MAG: benzoate-CoA ligase family protein [Kofleriaceae bacterium]|jgi:benzoate-CoA ligase family protein|nr:benzoate-CoA ligase family protein [Kofleriaceae bacterium]MBP6836199.1 benzoate-CoA ligase family protein [Kofleriaceae bacterium]MBP9203151.1 benzoate-CoA ligase family protein [Kofleriaceae bacterium]